MLYDHKKLKMLGYRKRGEYREILQRMPNVRVAEIDQLQAKKGIIPR